MLIDRPLLLELLFVTFPFEGLYWVPSEELQGYLEAQ